MDFCGQINTEEFDFFLSAWKSHGINSGAPAPLINEQAKTIIPSLSFVTESRVVELLDISKNIITLDILDDR